MQLKDYFDFQRPDDIHLKGSRIGIETVLYQHLHCSQSPEGIVRMFPSLSLEQVYATILYYLHNEAEVRKYLEDGLEYGRRAREEQRRNPSPAVARLMKLKEDLDRQRRDMKPKEEEVDPETAQVLLESG